MKVIAVLTTFGEFIGRVEDDFDLDTNQEIETHGAFTLEKPLKTVMIPGPHGPVNAMMPPSQFLDSSKLPIPADTVLLLGDAPQQVADQYLQMTSGIAIQKAAPSLIISKG